MQFTDSKSQQQSPLVAFLATTVLVILKFLFLVSLVLFQKSEIKKNTKNENLRIKNLRMKI